MKGIALNIKNYFSKKERKEETGKAPEGMCPTCWGFNEWDNKQYEVIRDKHLTPGGDLYDSFISKSTLTQHISMKTSTSVRHAIKRLLRNEYS